MGILAKTEISPEIWVWVIAKVSMLVRPFKQEISPIIFGSKANFRLLSLVAPEREQISPKTSGLEYRLSTSRFGSFSRSAISPLIIFLIDRSFNIGRLAGL